MTNIPPEIHLKNLSIPLDARDKPPNDIPKIIAPNGSEKPIA